jgi:hypothetical protein
VGNWRTVNIAGTMTGGDAAHLRAYLGYSFRVRDDPAMSRFGPLSFSRDQPSLCGLNDWPNQAVSRAGNLAERGYDPDDVAQHLRELVTVAGSMMLAVHCGGDYEALDCVATIRVGEGLVAVGKPEVERIREMGDEQAAMNAIRALSGGY